MNKTHEEFPAYSLEISPETAADAKVKLEEIFEPRRC